MNITDLSVQSISDKTLDRIENAKVGVALINPSMDIVWTNKAFREMLPWIDEEKKHICKQLSNSSKNCSTCSAFSSGKTISMTTEICNSQSVYNRISKPLKKDNNKVIFVVDTIYNTDWMENADTNKNKAANNLAKEALSGIEPTKLMNSAVELTVKSLNVDSCKILETFSNGKVFLLRANAGNKGKQHNSSIIKAGTDSQASYTLNSFKPVIVKNIKNEKRFGSSPLINDDGITSGINIIIPGTSKPFGILTAYTKEERIFKNSDILFLMHIAKLISMSVSHNKILNYVKTHLANI